MFCFIILLTISLTAMADDDADFGKCLAVLKSTEKPCCKEYVAKGNSLMNEEIKECKMMPNIPGSCDKALCFGTKLGLVSDDGTIYMEKFKKHIDGKLENRKDLLEAMNKKCYDDKYMLYGEPDECDINKIGMCLRWQYVFNCPEISDDEECKDIKDFAEKCQKLDF